MSLLQCFVFRDKSNVNQVLHCDDAGPFTDLKKNVFDDLKTWYDGKEIYNTKLQPDFNKL